MLLFAQYLVWGSWFVSLGSWLGATLHLSGTQIGSIYGTLALAGLVTPMLGGAIADRFARSERILALLHLLGGLLLIAASRQTTFAALYATLLLWALCYLPTLSLVPSLAMRHLAAPGVEYPALRTLGTIGWIAGGLTIGALGLELSPQPMQLAGTLSVLLGLYCLSLPATPPLGAHPVRNVRTLFGLDALTLLRDPLFLLFVVVSIVLSVPNQFYNAFASLYLTDLRTQHPAMVLTLGQMTEVLVLLSLPRLHRGLGSRHVLLLGATAWAVRMVLLSAGGSGGSVVAVYSGILLHGVAYGCVYVAGQLMVHERAPASIRASAQGLMAVATMGLGNLAGAWIAGRTVQGFTNAGGGHDWSAIWLVAAAFSTAATVCILFWMPGPVSGRQGVSAADSRVKSGTGSPKM